MPDSTKRILTDETGQDIVSALQSLQDVIDPNGTAVAAAAKIDNMTVAASSLATGATPTATISEVNNHKHIAFGIPTGATGATPQLSIGTVSTVAATENAVATLSGTTTAPVLNLQIPRGVSGNETIDDTKGIRDTDYVWSADKSQKEVNGLDGKKANSENLYLYKEVSGSVVTVDDAVAEAVKQMQIAIGPVQDLHGYDHPWPGGGGKNLLDPDYRTVSTNNIRYYSGNDKIFPAGTYTLSCGTAVMGLYVQTGDTNIESKYGTTSLTFTLAEDTPINFNFYNSEGIDTNLKCQLEVGSMATAWTPYSNICPISGWTGAKVTRTGKNLCTIQDRSISSAGYAFQGNLINNAGGIPAGTYTVSFVASGFTNGKALEFIFIDKNNQTINSGSKTLSSGRNSITITIERNAVKATTYTNSSSGVSLSDFQIEAGSTATTYESYSGITLPISWQSEAGTVYGGTVKIEKDGTGKLVVDRYYDVFDGNKTYQKWAQAYPIVRYDPSVAVKPVSINYDTARIISSYIQTRDAATTANYDVTGISVTSFGGIIFRIKGLTYDENIAYITANPLHVVYELATPITYTLTAPEIITLLSGLNNVWSDMGNILSMLYPVDSKADKNGEYEHLIAGSALQLLGQYTDENVPYVFRKTPVNSKRVREKLVGGTVAWNQLVQHGNFDATTGWSTNAGATFSVSNNVATIIGDAANECIYRQIPNVKDHVYLITCESGTSDVANSRPIAYYKSGFNYVEYDGTASKRYSTIFKSGSTDANLQFRFGVVVSSANVTMTVRNANVFDLTQMFGSTIADAIYAMEQATAGSGVTWFRSLFPKDYYAYNAGELMSVQAASKVTTGFNLWDEEWEHGSINMNTGELAVGSNIRSKNLIPVVPNTQYHIHYGSQNTHNSLALAFYNEQMNFVSNANADAVDFDFITPVKARYMRFRTGGNNAATTYIHNICLNFSNPSKNGTYEPYSSHTYLFDSDLILRGVPKWDSTAGKMYYDGDEYMADGTVTRKYKIVDLGTLAYTRVEINGTGRYRYATPLSLAKSGSYTGNVHSISTLLLLNDGGTGSGTVDGYTITDNKMLYIYIDGKSTLSVQDFATAMSGVYMVYELATPTTETADPYQEVQICDGGGTEEFVDGGNRDVAVPVGHESKYSADIWQIIVDLQAAIIALQS